MITEKNFWPKDIRQFIRSYNLIEILSGNADKRKELAAHFKKRMPDDKDEELERLTEALEVERLKNNKLEEKVRSTISSG